MTAIPIIGALRKSTIQMRFSYTVLLAIAVNFLWAEGHDQQRCIELVVLATGLVVVLASGTLARAVDALPAVVRQLALAFLLLGLCATLGVFSPSRAIAEWSMFALLGLAGAVIAAEFSAAGEAGRYRFLQALAWVAALYTMRLLLVYGAAIASGVRLSYHLLAVGFSNARFLNNTQTALIPLLVLVGVLSTNRRPMRALAYATAALSWAILFYSEGRATMLALGIGFSAALLVRRNRAAPYLKAMLITGVGGIGLYFVLFFAIPMAAGMPAWGAPHDMVARSMADPASNRFVLWSRALALIAQHPLLGVGPQHFAHFGADLRTGAHPHDWILQIAVEWGIPAWLCLAGILVIGMRALLRAGGAVAAEDRRNQAMASGLLVAVVAIVVDGLFSGVLVMPQSQLSIALVFGAAAGWVRSMGGVPARAPARATHTTVALVAAMAVCGLAFTAAPDFARKWSSGNLNAEELAHNPDVHWPRLWEANYF